MAAGIAALALSGLPILAGAAECTTASQDCAALIELGCLPALHAGSVSAGSVSSASPAECDSQKRAYKGCMQDLVQRCDSGPAPSTRAASQPSASWGGEETAAMSADPSACALGRWTGWVVEPGFSSYTIELEIGAQNGVAFARSWYPELSCGGGGSAVAGSRPDRLLLSETITTNRDRCADGQFSLTCLGDGRLLWRWYRNTGESFDAVLTRR